MQGTLHPQERQLEAAACGGGLWRPGPRDTSSKHLAVPTALDIAVATY
jgi:hypothetical protein